MTATAPFSAAPIGRRAVLATGTAGAGLATLTATAGSPADAAGAASDRYFRHGVASGDPEPDAVVIWTRLTPSPEATPGSGEGPRATVAWQVATDRRFRSVVRRGTVVTGASRDHTVKVDVTGLRPGRWYYYRFTYRGARSHVGRTRTAPAPDAAVRNVRFGVVSCSNWQAGFFGAYRGLAARDDLHAVVHLGDYLYEYAPGRYGMGAENVDVRKHVPAREMVSLADYRQRHAQYKTDPSLQALHAKYPWIITWDDHEVTNDQWSDGAENHQASEGDYHRRRARAHRAYDEWMPVRMNGTADLGDGTRLFRRLRFGRLLELSMLDLRTYRSRQVETLFPSPVPATEAEISDPDRTITGDQQMAWLKDSLSRRAPQWKIIGNPVMIAPVALQGIPDELLRPVNDVLEVVPDDGFPINVDQWDGYTADRNEIFGHIRDHQVTDAVFITGDIHSGWACDLPYDATTYTGTGVAGDTAGVEFVCTSVTSNNLKDQFGTPAHSPATEAAEAAILANNRHVKYLNFDDHGFSVLDVTPTRTQMDWFVISSRTDRDPEVRWEKSFQTLTGTSRVREVDAPVGR